MKSRSLTTESAPQKHTQMKLELRGRERPAVYKLGELTVWNKRLPLAKDVLEGFPTVATAAMLKSLESESNEVALIGSGAYMGHTSAERARQWLCDGHVMNKNSRNTQRILQLKLICDECLSKRLQKQT